MPRWVPNPVWEGHDVYLIGGGPSLTGFNWDRLRDKNTIGCNQAYELGADVCKVLVFGDFDFFAANRDGLERYAKSGGVVMSNHPSFMKMDLPWLWWTLRFKRGLSKEDIGWNMSTGAAAISLALLLGARRVFMLGYDLGASQDGRTNWHDKGLRKARPQCYARFIEGLARVAADVPLVFPGREVINVTNGSASDAFPKIGVEEHFLGRSVA